MTEQETAPSNNTVNATLRERFLANVRDIVCKDRNTTHGDPEDNFATIAELWSAYVRARYKGNVHAFDSLDVAVMCDLIKTSRIATTPMYLDHWLDKAGYSTCGGGIVMKWTEKEKPAPAPVISQREAEHGVTAKWTEMPDQAQLLDQAQLNKIADAIKSGKIRFGNA